MKFCESKPTEQLHTSALHYMVRKTFMFFFPTRSKGLQLYDAEFVTKTAFVVFIGSSPVLVFGGFSFKITGYKNEIHIK